VRTSRTGVLPSSNAKELIGLGHKILFYSRRPPPNKKKYYV